MFFSFCLIVLDFLLDYAQFSLVFAQFSWAFCSIGLVVWLRFELRTRGKNYIASALMQSLDMDGTVDFDDFNLGAIQKLSGQDFDYF